MKYNFHVNYISGKNNNIADLLSRRFKKNSSKEKFLVNLTKIKVGIIKTELISTEQKLDSKLKVWFNYILKNKLPEDSANAAKIIRKKNQYCIEHKTFYHISIKRGSFSKENKQIVLP